MDIKETLFSLSNSCGIADVKEAASLAKNILKDLCTVRQFSGLSFCGEFNSNKEKTILIEAHIDEIGMVVTNVDENGFLTVASCGGVDLKILPATQVVIHSQQKHIGIFSSVPMHLSSGNEEYKSISELKIDTGLGKKAKDLIGIGDFVTFDVKADYLCDGRVTGKAFDNRAGCTVLLELAKRLSKKELPVNVVLMFSDAEELGMRGARTAVYNIEADCAVAVDVSFASAPGVPQDKCGVLGKGGMVGFSPVLCSKISKKLVLLAKESSIAYQTEVMGSSTGTDADVISLIKEGIPCGLVSIPLRNMHSPAEIVDLNDIIAVADLLEQFILCGGVQ